MTAAQVEQKKLQDALTAANSSADINNNNNNDGKDADNKNTAKIGSKNYEKYSLRPRSIQNRIETEKRRKEEKPKKKGPKPKSRAPPLSKYRRKTANARERDRMKDINSAFEALQKTVPAYPILPKNAQGKTCEKLTKITTLKLAMNYIQTLSQLLSSTNPPDPNTTAANNDNSNIESSTTLMEIESSSSPLPQTNNNNNSIKNINVMTAPIVPNHYQQLPSLISVSSTPVPLILNSNIPTTAQQQQPQPPLIFGSQQQLYQTSQSMSSPAPPSSCSSVASSSSFAQYIEDDLFSISSNHSIGSSCSSSSSTASSSLSEFSPGSSYNTLSPISSPPECYQTVMRSVVLPANCSPRPNHNPSHNTPQHYVTSTLSMIPRNNTTINLSSHNTNNSNNNNHLSTGKASQALYELQLKPISKITTKAVTSRKKSAKVTTAAQIKYNSLPATHLSTTTSYLSNNHQAVTALLAECSQQQKLQQQQAQSSSSSPLLKNLISANNFNLNNLLNCNNLNSTRTGSLSSLTESDLSEYCTSDLLSDEGSTCLDDPMFDDIIGNVGGVVSTVDDLDLLLDSDGDSLHFTSSELSE